MATTIFPITPAPTPLKWLSALTSSFIPSAPAPSRSSSPPLIHQNSISTSTQWIQLSTTDPSKLANRKMHLTEGDAILKDLAEETGGRAFFPYHVDDLNQSFQDIGDELRNQYTITYSPSNFVANGRYHRIKVEIPNHNGYQVRARRGYFAKSRTSAAAPQNSAPPAPAGQSPPGPKS